ncbi:hypothetical protein QBC46DRAFT_400899 [Diplogelasinospora grovesii]|uniref:Heparan-alpha-glucosaminide N-acetyltransferase catalytic domain-containing protein n=1 Tax=Diplogelasinospora grovesii TaxID=303347 RepID=A0AAN6RZ87_9PEZI|nr:hypothetical protein QBC46DRAFT_400899 [Diplogelasinospora grovesii]
MGDNAVTFPPQPDPAVQETSFAADTSPPSERDNSIQNDVGRNGYGSIPERSTAPAEEGRKRPSTRALAPDLLRGLLMVLMALDHNTMALKSWAHGTAIEGEADGVVVHEWNRPIAIVIRTLTHLCAPGFTFLLGMGLVYFGRSRTNLGWPAARMARHFLLRAVALTGVTIVMGLAVSAGQIWFLNIVLFALAVDYLLAGLLWLVISKTEQSLAYFLLRMLPEKAEDDPTEPLLQDREGMEGAIAPDRTIIRAADISWHVHNALLLALAVVAIWWNVWLSPTGGHCRHEQLPSASASWENTSEGGIWWRIWFHAVQSPHVVSGFPPMAWLSFAVLGLLYGRVILARSWTQKAIVAGNALSAAAFAVVFVLTRLLPGFGNLSRGCLQMSEQREHPDTNQYLVSVPSFFYIIKYPPDVAFWSFTMAGNLLLLALFGLIPSRIASRIKVLLVYGTSALFFYVLHIFLLFALAVPVIAWLGHPVKDNDPWTGEPAVGVDQLWAFFGNWAVVLAILYPLCRLYGNFKRTREPDSIWRFF